MNKKLKEYLELNKDFKIYCKEDDKSIILNTDTSLSDKIFQLVRSGDDTFYDEDLLRFQCRSGRYRSFTDLYFIFRTYIPELDINEFAYQVLEAIHKYRTFESFRCPNIRKIVFYNSTYGTRDYDLLHRNSFMRYGRSRTIGCDGISWNNVLMIGNRYAKKNKLEIYWKY